MKKKVLFGASLYATFILIWFLYAQSGESFWLPKPGNVLARSFSASLRAHMLATGQIMVYSASLAFMVSLPLSWILSRTFWLRLTMNSFLILFQVFPMFVLAPLMILWFGWTKVAIIVPAALTMLFPLMTYCIRGFLATPKEYIDFFRVHGTPEKKIFFQLKLPSAFPYIFTGLRICVSFSGASAVAGEWAGAQEGLGVFLQECRRMFDVEGMFAGIFCLFMLTLTLYFFFYGLEKVVCKEVKSYAL